MPVRSTISMAGHNCCYLLIFSMVQTPSWATSWFAASQEIHHILRNPNIYYRNHKRPPPVSIQGQPNPLHIPTFHVLEIHFNIIHSSTPRSIQWFFLSIFPTKTLCRPILHPYAPHAQPISFFSILSTTKFWVSSTNHLSPRYAISSIPHYLVRLRSKYSPQYHILKHPRLLFFP